MTNFPALKTPGPLADGAMRVTPLGGLGEVGRNMTVFELGGKLLIVDCGVLFPGRTSRASTSSFLTSPPSSTASTTSLPWS